MFVFISVAFEHWILSGWVLIISLLSITQMGPLIENVVKAGMYHKYESCVIALVGSGFIWAMISTTSLLRKIWLIL